MLSSLRKCARRDTPKAVVEARGESSAFPVALSTCPRYPRVIATVLLSVPLGYHLKYDYKILKVFVNQVTDS